MTAEPARKRVIPMHLFAATLYLLLAYAIVTVLGALLTVLLAVYMPPAPAGTPMLQIPAYSMSVPFHPLLNLLVWPVFACAYLYRRTPARHRQIEALRLGFFWVAATAVIDLFGWVLLPHPWRMTLNQFYVGYQPWISLIYFVIFISPILAALDGRIRGTIPTATGLPEGATFPNSRQAIPR